MHLLCDTQTWKSPVPFSFLAPIIRLGENPTCYVWGTFCPLGSCGPEKGALGLRTPQALQRGWLFVILAPGAVIPLSQAQPLGIHAPSLQAPPALLLLICWGHHPGRQSLLTRSTPHCQLKVTILPHFPSGTTQPTPSLPPHGS